jgi:hypothetical protein
MTEGVVTDFAIRDKVIWSDDVTLILSEGLIAEAALVGLVFLPFNGTAADKGGGRRTRQQDCADGLGHHRP